MLQICTVKRGRDVQQKSTLGAERQRETNNLNRLLSKASGLTMHLWRMVIVGILCCYTKTSITHSQSKALFPAASRTKRGTANVMNPTFFNSFTDVHLLYEILLTGIHFEDSGEITVKDAELASLRKTQNLEIICEEIIPKRLTDIFRLISGLSYHTGHLCEDDFERILLTLVYITQQMVSSTTEQQRDVWAESFVSLYKAVKQDLTS